MVPSTRLQARKSRRVDYSTGSRNDPIVILPSPARELEPEPEAVTTSTQATGRARYRTRAQVRGTNNTVATVGKTTKGTYSKVTKTTAKTKKKEQPKKTECSICAETKSIPHSFKLVNDENACQHFKTICKLCISKLLNTKVSSRQLTEAELSCPFPDCDYFLELATIKRNISKAAFDKYENALFKNFLSTEESYIACISPDCGNYFCIEKCKGKARSKFMIECPYCDYQICLTCTRPWASHGSKNCATAKAQGELATAKALKKLGAKPCPKCSMNIQKAGGCDHLTCQHCGHHFCWSCLVPYTANIQHTETCIHGRTNAAADPRNWAQPNLNITQLNRLIEQNMAQLNNPGAIRADEPPAPLPIAGWDAAPEREPQLELARQATPPALPAVGNWPPPIVHPARPEVTPREEAEAPRPRVRNNRGGVRRFRRAPPTFR